MSDADVLGAGTSGGPSPVTPGTQPFTPEPAAFIPGAQWVNLVSGSLSISSAISVPNVAFLRPARGNNGIVGPQEGAVIFLDGIATPRDGGQRALIWDATSVVADDGVGNFNPWVIAGTPGRWRRLGGRGTTTVPQSAGPFLASGVLTPIVSTAVPPGEWDIYGTLYFNQSVPGLVNEITALLSPDGSFDYSLGLPGVTRISFAAGGSFDREIIPVGPLDMENTVNTVMTMWARADFPSGTVQGYGSIYIRKAV